MKVLVVDDTKNIRMLLTTCLQLNGYNVITANDGVDALNLLKEDKIDLIFLDIKLPELSGTEVFRRIRNMGIDVPVVIMTAFATVKNAIECTKLGAVAYLQKPFTADKVKNVLDELAMWPSKPNDTLQTDIEKCRLLIAEDKVNEAYSYLKKLLSIDPSCGEIYFLIGKVHEKNNNSVEAQRFFNIAKQFQ